MKNINHSSRPRRLTAMAGSFAAVVSIGTALLLLAGIHSSQAGEIKTVSPSAYKDTEGEGGIVGGGGSSPFRLQAVFPAEDFAALGNKPHWLVGITFRPDQSLTNPHTIHDPDSEVRLATMPVGPPNLSLRFDDNLGSNFKHWYRGPVTWAADVAGPGPGPREFYNIDTPAGVTPYLYDPSQGNLLLDVIFWQGRSASDRADQVPGILTALYGSSPFATDGNLIPAAVHQFTFVPVPEPSAVSIDLIPTGVRLRFTGVPGLGYNLERAPAVTGPWSTINTQTAPASGLLEYLDTTPHPGSGFYRTVQP